VTVMFCHTSCTPRDTAKLLYVLNHQHPGKEFMSHPKQKSQVTIILETELKKCLRWLHRLIVYGVAHASIMF